MAGYSYLSPVGHNNTPNKRKLSSISNRRVSTPSSYSSTNDTLKMTNNRVLTPNRNSISSKVIKSKARLKMNTFQQNDREAYRKMLSSSIANRNRNPSVARLNFTNNNNSLIDNNNIYNNNNASSSIGRHNFNSLPYRPNTSINDYRNSTPTIVTGRSSLSLVDVVKANGLTVSFTPKLSSRTFTSYSVDDRMPPLSHHQHDSKLNKIRQAGLPEKSQTFKSIMDKKFGITQTTSVESIVQRNQQCKLSEKLETVNVIRSNRQSLLTKLKNSLFPSTFLSSFNLFNRFRNFKPYKLDDYQVSEESLYKDEDKIVPLTEEMEHEIWEILNSDNRVIVQAFALNVHTSDLSTLCGTTWLNDVVIEFYLNLIQLRSNEPKYPSVYVFNTYFFPRLLNGSTIGRWANKLDFFSYDLLLVPIHHSSHWRLAVVDNQKKSIEYYDSLGNEFRDCINLLAEFMQSESIKKRKTKLDMSQWKLIYRISDIPLQGNMYDCGVFACKYAEYISRRAPLSFTQDDIPYFRKCMIYEISHKQLLV